MSVKTWCVAVLWGMALALALPIAAQEETTPPETAAPPETRAETPAPAPAKKKQDIEDPPLHRWGGFTISLAGWSPTLVGADEDIATVYSAGIGETLLQGSDSSIEETVVVAYHLPKGFGSIVAQYDAMGADDYYQNYAPGQFVFGETRAYPAFLGAFDDGLADGVSSSASRTTRLFRLDYQNQAFETKWARGTWSIGYRQVSHSRDVDIDYFAIVPNLPPVIPPVVGENEDPLRLAPLPDTVDQSSGFSGHGLGATIDVEFPVHPRVSIISGLSVGLYRGETNSFYASQSSYYYLIGTPDVPLTKDELFDLLSNPPPPSGDPDNPEIKISDIQQGNVVVGLNSPSNAQFAQSFDVYLGVQAIVYKGLRVFLTLRDVLFVNVGEYVVPKPGPSTQTTSLSAGYEGYAVGISWRF